MNLEFVTQLTAGGGIQNRALSLWGSGGARLAPDSLAGLIVVMWRVLFTLGGLAVLIYMALGAVSWITSGGDKGKVEEARNKITAAIIGITVMFSIFALVNYIFPLIGFDILNPVIDDNLSPVAPGTPSNIELGSPCYTPFQCAPGLTCNDGYCVPL